MPKKRGVALYATVTNHPSDENAFRERAKKATSEIAPFSNGLDIIIKLETFSYKPINEIKIHDHGFVYGIIGDGNNVGMYTQNHIQSVPFAESNLFLHLLFLEMPFQLLQMEQLCFMVVIFQSLQEN